MKVGSQFRITKQSHWGYGRIFTVSRVEPLRIKGNRDQPDLVWEPDELVHFRASAVHGREKSAQPTEYVIPVEWTREVKE